MLGHECRISRLIHSQRLILYGDPPRRKTELTVAILQLVTSRRALAAMPGWAVQPFLDRDYVASKPIRMSGLFANLYAVTTEEQSRSAYMMEFPGTMRRISFSTLKRIEAAE